MDKTAHVRLMSAICWYPHRPHPGRETSVRRLSQLSSDCHIVDNVRWMSRRMENQTATVGKARRETSDVSRVKAWGLRN